MMPTDFSTLDVRYMRRALTLAAKSQGNVEPNPMVGAVLTTPSGEFISQGYHKKFGGPHAEIHAIRAADSRAKNATLYVTLEPCCHFGKTPPCTDAILAAGIARVVIAMKDPFPKVDGGGIRILKKAGLQVEVGLLEAEARALNAPFITRLSLNRPFVIAKWAQSLDGTTALANGISQWISSEPSRALVQILRGRMDAILVGINTAIADNPLLMARPGRGADIKRTATRIIIDSRCRLPLDSQLVKTISFAPVMVAHNKNLDAAAKRRLQKLTAAGVISVPLPADKQNRPHIPALLKHLAQLDYTNILVEGGPSLMATFARANLIDEAHIFLAPTLLGGAGARHAVGGLTLTNLTQATQLRILSATASGPDLHVIARKSNS